MAGAAHAAPEVTGNWIIQDRSAVIAIERCGTGLCGRIAKALVTKPNYPKTDVHNPIRRCVNGHDRPAKSQRLRLGKQMIGHDLRPGESARPTYVCVHPDAHSRSALRAVRLAIAAWSATEPLGQIQGNVLCGLRLYATVTKCGTQWQNPGSRRAQARHKAQHGSGDDKLANRTQSPMYILLRTGCRRRRTHFQWEVRQSAKKAGRDASGSRAAADSAEGGSAIVAAATMR